MQGLNAGPESIEKRSLKELLDLVDDLSVSEAESARRAESGIPNIVE